MNEKKIFIEQSVLVAVSIGCFVKELDIVIEDDFHKISKNLFEFIKDKVDEEIGIITDFVMEQTEEGLSDIIFRKLKQIETGGKFDKMKLFTSYSDILRECMREMRINVKNLLRVPIKEDVVRGNITKVSDFYHDLTGRIIRKDPSKDVDKKTEQACSGGHIVSSSPDYWHGIFREEKNPDFIAFEKLSHKFLVRGKGPDDVDRRILSECIYLKERYAKKGSVIIFLTANDQHFVKLRNVKSELSTFVPDEIKKNFGIECEWPDDLLKIMLKK